MIEEAIGPKGDDTFQDIGASKAPQPDFPAAFAALRPTALPGRLPAADCNDQPAVDCANQPAADCSPTQHRQDPDVEAISRTRRLYLNAIMYSVTCRLALFMK